MGVVLRLKRAGAKKKPFFRLVAADSRMPRDGRFLELLGYYNPISKPAEIKIDVEKVKKWLDNGALPSPTAKSLLKKAGLVKTTEKPAAQA